MYQRPAAALFFPGVSVPGRLNGKEYAHGGTPERSAGRPVRGRRARRGAASGDRRLAEELFRPRRRGVHLCRRGRLRLRLARSVDRGPDVAVVRAPTTHDPQAMTMILIVTGEDDVHADRVQAELERRDAEVARFDPAWFPAEASVSVAVGSDGAVGGRLGFRGREIELERIGAVWR